MNKSGIIIFLKLRFLDIYAWFSGGRQNLNKEVVLYIIPKINESKCTSAISFIYFRCCALPWKKSVKFYSFYIYSPWIILTTIDSCDFTDSQAHVGCGRLNFSVVSSFLVKLRSIRGKELSLLCQNMRLTFM